jgi:hypothetical protein
VCGAWNYQNTIVKDRYGNIVSYGTASSPFFWTNNYQNLEVTASLPEPYVSLSPYLIDFYAYQGTYTS